MPVFQTTQIIKADINKCWSFFSDPANLANITPPAMKFIIKHPHPVPEMYQGMIIKYKVSPLFNIPIEWITEITEVSKPDYFVDNQLKGPYKVWHHQHFFEETEGGVKITDIVTYSLPFGFIGNLLAGRLVRKKVEGIFEYRSKIIESVFQ
jgi:ligand-binding SRPBCC domain-containing protein